MASQTQGIQELLRAEKQAGEKVSEARKRKARRLKQAKEESQADVERYRQERERAFHNYNEQHMGSRDDIAKRIDQETDARLRQQEEDVGTKSHVVVNRILEVVHDIKPQLHTNIASGLF